VIQLMELSERWLDSFAGGSLSFHRLPSISMSKTLGTSRKSNATAASLPTLSSTTLPPSLLVHETHQQVASDHRCGGTTATKRFLDASHRPFCADYASAWSIRTPSLVLRSHDAAERLSQAVRQIRHHFSRSIRKHQEDPSSGRLMFW